jgi:hypothetical protein
MQSDPRKSDDLSDLRWLKLASVRRVLVQPEVSPVGVVVLDVLADHAAKLPLADGDHVVDPSLGIPVLPRRPQSRSDLLKTQSLDPLTEFPAIDRVIVAEQISAWSLEVANLDDLMSGPTRRRVLSRKMVVEKRGPPLTRPGGEILGYQIGAILECCERGQAHDQVTVVG